MKSNRKTICYWKILTLLKFGIFQKNSSYHTETSCFDVIENLYMIFNIILNMICNLQTRIKNGFKLNKIWSGIYCNRKRGAFGKIFEKDPSDGEQALQRLSKRKT